MHSESCSTPYISKIPGRTSRTAKMYMKKKGGKGALKIYRISQCFRILHTYRAHRPVGERLNIVSRCHGLAASRPVGFIGLNPTLVIQFLEYRNNLGNRFCVVSGRRSVPRASVIIVVGSKQKIRLSCRTG